VSLTYSHFGICVSDLERSLRFYCDGLGFTPSSSFDVGPEFGTLMEIEGVQVESRFLRRDGLSVELLHYLAPGHVGEAVRRPVNQLGLTHLCFKVDDVDVAAEAVATHGGTVLTHTRTTFDGGDAGPMDFVYCTDPDGTRIELMRVPG
jgi:catechol 2,3-dioxygenase-like lactoylglutathione lyase family enzyme